MILFIGSFSDPSLNDFQGSGAGAKVQSEIIDALKNQEKNIVALIMPEVPSWPKGKLIHHYNCFDVTRYLPIINFSFLKRLVFFVQVVFYFIYYKPKTVFYYNSSFLTCLLSAILGFFGTSRVLILQDVIVPKFETSISFFNLRHILQFLYIKILPYTFDFYIPVSRHCITDLYLPEEKSVVFPGAVPIGRMREFSDSYSLISISAVFAGALEDYNGVDMLINNWPHHDDIKFPLNIFGSGRLSSLILEKSKLNPNIIYHGFKSPAIVDEYLLNSRINFCFRYSKGIDQRFFFPSKFFDLILLPGYLVCNRFDNIPQSLVGYITIIDDDFFNLEDIIMDVSRNGRYFGDLFSIIENGYTWRGFIKTFMHRYSL